MSKRDAEQWVQLFVDYYPNATGNAETAVLGVTTLGALVDFLGEIPPSTGYRGDSVSWRIDRMRRVHPDFVQAFNLVSLLSGKPLRACLEWAYWRGRRPVDSNRHLQTQKDVAEYLGVDYQPWRVALFRGHDEINAALGKFIA